MTFSMVPVLDEFKRLMEDTQIFSVVQIGEPRSAPENMTCAIFLWDLMSAGLTLSTSIDVWTVVARIYYNAMHEPYDEMELGIADGVTAARSALAGEYRLSGLIRAVGWAAEEGNARVSVKFAHVDQSGTMFRIADIMVPLIVDDSMQFTA